MKFSVLHISDLHRDPNNEIDSIPLLDSIVRDWGRYALSSPPIQRPALGIVSGDLVFGTRKTGDEAIADISRQYEMTLKFLGGLADTLFNGDRSRIVLVPGNHDVFAPSVAASTVAVPFPTTAEDRKKLVQELFEPMSALRWSWGELAFKRITNEATYNSRFEHYAKAYNSFYEGHRKFSLAPEQQFDVFDFSELNFTIYALNSCFRNDLDRRAGAFHPVALSSVCREAMSPSRAGRLQAAVWHHNLYGGPTQDDYLDNTTLQHLIDAGISLAFHGHQHVMECVEERFRLGATRRKITAISAGTLCAGPHHLQPGEPRSYNVVEFDTDLWRARVHQRKMVNREYVLPIWGPGSIIASDKSYLDFEVQAPETSRPPALDMHLGVERAAELTGQSRWTEALNALRPFVNVPLAKPLLRRVLIEGDFSREAIEFLNPPETIEDAVILSDALGKAGTQAEIAAFLDTSFVRQSTDASLKATINRLSSRRSS